MAQVCIFLEWKAKISSFGPSACDRYHGCVCCPQPRPPQPLVPGLAGGCVGDVPPPWHLPACSRGVATAWAAFHASRGSQQRLRRCQIPHLASSAASAAAASRDAPRSWCRGAPSELLSLPGICSRYLLFRHWHVCLCCFCRLMRNSHLWESWKRGEKKVFLALASVGKGLWLWVGGISEVLGTVKKKIQMDFFFFFLNLIAFKWVFVIFWVQFLSNSQAGGAETARQPWGAPPLPRG